METKLMWLKNVCFGGQIKDLSALRPIPSKNRWDTRPHPTLTHPTRRTCAACSTASVYRPYQHPLPQKGIATMHHSSASSAFLVSKHGFLSDNTIIPFSFYLLQVAFPIHLLWPSPRLSLPPLPLLAGLLHESALKCVHLHIAVPCWLSLPTFPFPVLILWTLTSTHLDHPA